MALNRILRVATQRCVMLIAIIFSLGYNASSQSQKGKLSGVVYDDENSPITNAMISLDKHSLTSHTNRKGEFFFSVVLAGTYEISVYAVGYETKKQWISINANEDYILAIKLNRNAAMLETVTVTTEKKTTLIQKTPGSVSILNAQKMEDYRLWSLSDLNAVVPNLLVTHMGSDLPTYSIRGIFSNSLNQSVAVYIDGVIQYDADNTLRNLYNVERMEVLRGPQGTLYGRNAMAGVINIITKKPNNIISGYGDISFGNFGTQHYSAGINTPILNSKLFIGLSGSYNKSGGYYTNSYNDKKLDKNSQFEGNINLRYLPVKDWVFSLSLKGQTTVNHGTFPYIINDSIALSDGYITSQNVQGTHSRHLYSTSLSVQHYGKWLDLTSITGFQHTDKFVKNGRWDGDWTAYDFFEMGYAGSPKDNYARTLTQEIRLNSLPTNSNKLSWTAGVFYMYHPEKETSLLFAGNDASTILKDPYAPYTLSTPSALTNKGYALFGQATYNPIPRLNITAGIRYDRETKYMYTQTTMIKEGYPNMDLVERIKLSGKYNAVSPKFNIAYHLDSKMMIYVNYSRGFRAGGLNARSTDPNFFAYNPEFSDSYETGYKASWFDQKLLTNLTLFHTNWKDMQVTAFGNNPAETGIRNTGNAIVKGLEIELLSIPAKGLSIDYHFSYNHGRYTQLTKPDVATGTEKNLKGNWLIMQPELMSMLAAQYSFTLIGKIKSMIRSEWSALGRHYLNIENTVLQTPYSLFNAKVGISYSKFELQFWAKNIFNKRYLSYVYPSGAPYTMLGLPATFGTGIITKF